MPNPDPNEPDDPHPTGEGLVAQLPRLPVSLRRPAPPPPAEPPGPATEELRPPGPGPVLEAQVPNFTPPRTDTSSKGSTDPKAPRPPGPLVPPEKLSEAITQAADVALVLAGQGLGQVISKGRGETRDPQRWTPTGAERALILKPTSSIIARHIRGDIATADAIDAAMVAAGLSHFVVRAALDLELLPEETKETK